jgi:hypothetical protein
LTEFESEQKQKRAITDLLCPLRFSLLVKGFSADVEVDAHCRGVDCAWCILEEWGWQRKPKYACAVKALALASL